MIADFEGGDPAAMINTTHEANVTVFRDAPQGGGKLAAKTVVDEAAGAADYFGTGFGFPALDLSDSAEIRIWIKTDIEGAFNLQVHSEDNRASVYRFSIDDSDSGTWKQLTAPVASFKVPPWSPGEADWTRVNKVQITAFGSGPYDGEYIIIDNVICAVIRVTD